MGFLLPYQMTDADSTSLSHRNTEKIDKHNDIDAVSPGRQCFYTEHIDEIGDHYLRRTVR